MDALDDAANPPCPACGTVMGWDRGGWVCGCNPVVWINPVKDS